LDLQPALQPPHVVGNVLLVDMALHLALHLLTALAYVLVERVLLLGQQNAQSAPLEHIIFLQLQEQQTARRAVQEDIVQVVLIEVYVLQVHFLQLKTRQVKQHVHRASLEHILRVKGQEVASPAVQDIIVQAVLIELYALQANILQLQMQQVKGHALYAMQDIIVQVVLVLHIL